MEKEPIKALMPFVPHGFKGAEELVELALDLRWSWKHSTDEIWKRIDKDLWERTQNPWIILRTVSPEKIKKALSENGFYELIQQLYLSKKEEEGCSAWFQERCSVESPFNAVAYFSMEYMITEALPIYSGGLGNVAGDFLKTASNLGVPLYGVGLLYQQGYFRQILDHNGVQQALYPFNDPGQLPIKPLRDKEGDWLRIEIQLPGYCVWLRVWEAQVGRVQLFLLDSNDAANYPVTRGIVSELYNAEPESRLKQELILGIGGYRIFEALGIKPDICHLNEGHAAFAVFRTSALFYEGK